MVSIPQRAKRSGPSTKETKSATPSRRSYRDGLLYVDSGRGGMGVAVDATGAGDVSKTHLKWKVPNVTSGLSSPILVGDYLYRVHGSTS